MPDVVMMNNQQLDMPDLFHSGCQTPIENLWFATPEERRRIFGMPEALPLDSVSSARRDLTDSPPHNQIDLGTQFDVSMSDLIELDQSDPSAWDFMNKNLLASFDSGLTGLQPQNIVKAGPQLPTSIHQVPDSVLRTPFPEACTCLQQNAELLSHPTVAEMNACDGSNSSALSLDKALSLARRGVSAWRSLIACSKCPYSNDQEVTFLAYMGIRSVTRYFQRLSPRYIASNAKSPNGADVSPTRETIRLMVGCLEVDGDEHTLVCRLLFQKALQSVRQSLHSLQAIQCKRKRQLLQGAPNHNVGMDDCQMSSSLLHVQQLSHALATSLKDLESAFHQQ